MSRPDAPFDEEIAQSYYMSCPNKILDEKAESIPSVPSQACFDALSNGEGKKLYRDFVVQIVMVNIRFREKNN